MATYYVSKTDGSDSDTGLTASADPGADWTGTVVLYGV